MKRLKNSEAIGRWPSLRESCAARRGGAAGGRLRSGEEPKRETLRRVKRGKEGLCCVWLPPSGAHLPSPQQSRTVRSDRESRRRSRTNDSPLLSPTIGRFPPPHDRATPRELFDLLPTLLSPFFASSSPFVLRASSAFSPPTIVSISRGTNPRHFRSSRSHPRGCRSLLVHSRRRLDPRGCREGGETRFGGAVKVVTRGVAKERQTE